MTRTRLILALITVLALTIAPTFIHGRISGRWGATPEAIAAAKQFANMSREFGDWVMIDDMPLDTFTANMLEPYAYLNRRYRHVNSEQVISVFVLLGPMGPVASHTPEVCFSTRNYTALGDRLPVKLTVPGHGVDAFWTNTYRSTTVDGGLQRVWYAWSTGSHWQASDNSRKEFAGSPYLYKIQTAGLFPPNTDFDQSDLVGQFLRDFTPELQRVMVPATNH